MILKAHFVVVDYFYWQFVLGPVWLVLLIWNIERALLRYFSVRVMMRTWLAHWHKDALPYKGGSISNLLITFAWNQISRAIGFIIRTAVLAIWLVSAAVFLGLSAAVLLLFLLAPLVVLIGIAAGLALLVLPI